MILIPIGLKLGMRLGVAIFLISTCALSYQFFLTRILSVIHWQSSVYAVLTFSLLGMALSGWVLRASQRLRALSDSHLMLFCTLGFAISAILSTKIIATLSEFLVVSYFVGMFPFCFFGLLLLSGFERHPESSGRFYAMNLLGTAAGCLCFVFGLRALGANGFLLGFVFLPMAILSLISALKTRRRTLYSLIALYVGLLFLGSTLHFEPNSQKQYTTLFPQKIVEHTEWNPLGRTDVIADVNSGSKKFLIDGDAQASLLPHWEGIIEKSVGQRQIPNKPVKFLLKQGEPKVFFVSYSHPASIDLEGNRLTLPKDKRWNLILLLPQSGKTDYYLLNGMTHGSLNPSASFQIVSSAPIEIRSWDKPLDSSEMIVLKSYFKGLFENRYESLEEVLVIGNGGGADVTKALLGKARQITSVEINSSTYELVQNKYAPYLQGLFAKNNVSFHLEDGRSFIARTKKQFNQIIMVGVDSFAAVTSGAYVLAESYLYTMEAFGDYLDHLTQDGRLFLSHFCRSDYPKEMLRAFIMAYETLKKSGISNPEKHLTVFTFDPNYWKQDSSAMMIVSKSPLLPNSINFSDHDALERPPIIIYPNKPSGNAFEKFVAHANAGDEKSFFDSYPFDVQPVYDDAPFFFQNSKWDHLFKPQPLGNSPAQGALLRMVWLFLECLVLALLLIVGPWRAVPRADSLQRIKTAVYFACLGVGFMCIEIAWLQKATLVLGHPIYSMAVTLPTLMIAAGIGSFLSTQFVRTTNETWVFIALLLMISTLWFWSPNIMAFSLNFKFQARALLVIATLLPVGILLGMPFPLALQSLSRKTELIRLAWTVNAALTVMGSLLAVLFAMLTGFQALLLGALMLYSAAALTRVSHRLSLPGKSNVPEWRTVSSS